MFIVNVSVEDGMSVKEFLEIKNIICGKTPCGSSSGLAPEDLSLEFVDMLQADIDTAVTAEFLFDTGNQ